MNDSACRQLADYLAGDIPAAERTAFDAHLRSCAACRDEVEAQRRIDELLRDANRRVEVLPGFHSLVERRIRRSGRLRIAAWAASAAVVALAAFSLGWLLPDEGDPPIPLPEQVVDAPPQPVDSAPSVAPDREPAAAVAESSSPPRVVVQVNNDAIALRVETTNPSVHIYRLLPAQPLAARSASSNFHPRELRSP